MDPRDKQQVIARYNQRLAEFGASNLTLAAGTEERRRLRFDTLLSVGVKSGSSVLDLGCGFGDLWSHLRERGLEVDYCGYDVNPELVAIARRRYPEARFEVVDIQESDFPRFDYVLSTSSFNNRMSFTDNYGHVNNVLELAYDHADSAVAVDFLSSYVDYTSPEAFYYEPERLFGMAKQLTRRVCLRHDYLPHEFCLYLYREAAP